jgi:hypothetical protein
MKLTKVLVVLLTLTFLLNAPRTLATDNRLIDSFGIWTLEKLGYSDLIFPCQQDTETISVEYSLPQHAAQGPRNWYLIHLNFRIEFSEQSQDGLCYVSAFTNKKSCAEIEFIPKREDGSLIIDWNTVDLINGPINYSSSSSTIDVSFTNYLQTSGVNPGLNVLTFALEKYGGAQVKSLKILQSSAIEYTAVSPPQLVMDVKPPKASVEVGDTFTIRFEVKNVGSLAAKDVAIQPLYPEQALQLIGESSYSVASLGTSIKGSFTFKALIEGQHEVTIDVTTKSGIRRPSASIEVPVGIKSTGKGSHSDTILIAVTAFVVLGLVTGYVLVRRARKRQASGRN